LGSGTLTDPPLASRAYDCHILHHTSQPNSLEPLVSILAAVAFIHICPRTPRRLALICATPRETQQGASRESDDPNRPILHPLAGAGNDRRGRADVGELWR
jgi:hypothetical protein